MLFPYEDGGTLSELYALAGNLERHEEEGGVRVLARVPRAHAHRFEPYVLNGRGADGAAESE